MIKKKIRKYLNLNNNDIYIKILSDNEIEMKNIKYIYIKNKK
jgi:hypothetical protein